MKLSFLAQRNILNVAVTIAVLMPAMAIGSVIAREPANKSPALIMSHEEMMHWIANTDAKLTFIGDSINPLSSRSAQDTTVIYCNTRNGNTCGGECTVYSGGATCLYAPGTNCLGATADVWFCNGNNCDGACNDYFSCGVYLANNYCYTPGTNSISVGSA